MDSRPAPISFVQVACASPANPRFARLARQPESGRLHISGSEHNSGLAKYFDSRKNWIHVGSKDAGPKVAAIASIVDTCRQLKIPIPGYPAGVLPGIAHVSIQRLADLTPSAWAAWPQKLQPPAPRCGSS